MEEADNVSASGEATLVSHGHLCSPIDDDANEPSLRDSLLLHDTELKHPQAVMFMLMIIHRAPLSQLTTTPPCVEYK